MDSQRIDELTREGGIDLYTRNQWYPVALHDNQRTDFAEEHTLVPITLLGKKIVLWRTGDKIVARRDICPHDFSAFSNTSPDMQPVISGENIECRYHGWMYGADGSSFSPPSNPKKKTVKQWCIEVYPVQQKYGWVWVCLGDSPSEIPPFPEWDDQAYTLIWCGPYPFDTSLGRSILNIADVSHFSFTHEGTLGIRERPEIPKYEVKWDVDTGVSARNVRIWQDDPDGQRNAGLANYSSDILKPHIVHFVKHLEVGNFVMYFTISPTTETTCNWWAWMAVNYDHNVDKMRDFQDGVAKQDQLILNNARVKRLTLDLKDGYPIIPADETSIAYKQWLTALGITYGTISAQ